MSGDASSALLQQCLKQLRSAEKSARDVNKNKDLAQKVYLGKTNAEYQRKRVIKNPRDWRSRLCPPVAFEHLELITAEIASDPPVFRAFARLDEYMANAKAATDAQAYYLDRDKFTRTFRTVMRRAAKFGDCPVKVLWKHETIPSSGTQVDPETGAESPLPDQVLFDGPTIIALDYRDFFPDPTARSMDDATFVFHRWRATRNELAARTDDEGNPFYTNLDELPGNPSSNDGEDQKRGTETAEAFEARRTGVQTIHERWTRYGCVTIANKSMIIRVDEDPDDPIFEHRKVPFEVIRLIEDDDSLGGVSLMLQIDHLQEAFWKFFNELVNAITITTNPPKLVDEENDPNSPKYDLYPGASIPTRNGEQTVKVLQDVANLAPYGMEHLLQSTRDLIERTTGMNSTVAGMGGASSATEASSNLNQSKNRIQFMIDTSDDDWSRVMLMSFQLVQQFADQQVVAKLTNGLPVNFGPDDLVGQFEFQSTLGSDRALRSQRMNDLSTLWNSLVPVITPGSIEFDNLSQLLEEMFETFKVGDLGASTKTAEQVQLDQGQVQLQIEAAQATQQLQQQQQQAAQMQPPAPAQAAPAPEQQSPLHEQLDMNYANLPPSVQRQAEAMVGFKPATDAESAAQLASMKPKPTTPGGSSSGKGS